MLLDNACCQNGQDFYFIVLDMCLGLTTVFFMIVRCDAAKNYMFLRIHN